MPDSAALEGAPAAGIGIRMLSAVYEALLLAAILLVATALFLALAGDARAEPARSLLRVFLAVVVGLYFVWSWAGGRQTLPMRTWRLYVVDRRGLAIHWRRGTQRYVYALLGTLSFGLTWFWALFDRDRLWLHDRLAGTRVVRAPAEARRPPPPG